MQAVKQSVASFSNKKSQRAWGEMCRIERVVRQYVTRISRNFEETDWKGLAGS